jgi:hypothetical protein
MANIRVRKNVQPSIYHAKNAKRAFKNLSRDVRDKVVNRMGTIVNNELEATFTRLNNKGLGKGNIYEKVAKSLDADRIDSPNDAQLPTFIFGSSSKAGARDFKGVTGSRGANISGILQFGKKKGSVLYKPMGVKPSARASFGGYNGVIGKDGKPVLWLMPGWASPAFAKEPMFLDRAFDNIKRKFDAEIPDMIEKGFGNKTIIIKNKSGISQ